jgi:lysophospholipase L1-like esterase
MAPPRSRHLVLALALTTAWLAACASPQAAGQHWVATWTAPVQLTEPRNLPPVPGLIGSTLRQVLHVSLGGSRVRVRFSNAFGDGALTIAGARIARSLGASTIDPASERALTFDGRDSVVIAADEMATCDPLDFDVEPLSDLSVTIYVPTAPLDVTGHPGSRTTSYLQAGIHVSAPALPDAATTDHWYLLTGLDVLADRVPEALVTLGNSITDGRGSGTNRNNRWPDNLARRLLADPRTEQVAVLNAGIGGNTVLAGGLGPPALTRLDRDVFEPVGARWLIVLEGVNDIGTSSGPRTATIATDLIAAYREIITQAHGHGMRVYGATILPFGGSFYDDPAREAARQTVNQWIRESGAWDAVIDFDAALRDPADPTRLLPAADTGDHLHPNELGYRMMADAVDLGLFSR